MNNFSEHWWMWVVALLVVLAFVWIMRARRSGSSRRAEADLSNHDRSETATELTGAASSTGAVGLRAEPEGTAAEAIIEEARTPEATSETEAALKRASDAVPAAPPASPSPEPVANVSAEPVAEPSAVPVPAAEEGDNLRLLKGVGPKLAARLGELGVTRFEQIAGWSESDIAEIDQHLGTFKGRPTRDNWVDQAGYLARGDKAGFEAKYGALG